MKFKKILIFIFVLAFVALQLFPVVSLAAPASYSDSLNSGTRDDVCTSLSGTGAADYYTGQYTYDALSTLAPDALLSTLRKFMTETHTTITKYSDCRDLAPETSCENGDGRIVLLYTSHSATYANYANGSGWNREHVWPKSLGGFKDERAGADLHHIRPSEHQTNSTRGNKKYGNVDSGSTVYGNLSSKPGGTYNSQYFEPNDNVKGDVARICLYVYVRWGGEYSQSNNILNVFESVETLLEWCELDPVDTWELGRNEVVEKIQGNRNVFIDYPELAWLLFDENIPNTMTTPSGEAKNATPDNTDKETEKEPDKDTEPVGCSHANTSVQGEKSSTCKEQGYTGTTYCSDCGVLLSEGERLPLADHSFDEGKTLVEPTAEMPGCIEYKCTVCGFSKVNELAALSGSDDQQKSGCGGFTASAYVFTLLAFALSAAVIKKK